MRGVMGGARHLVRGPGGGEGHQVEQGAPQEPLLQDPGGGGGACSWPPSANTRRGFDGKARPMPNRWESTEPFLGTDWAAVGCWFVHGAEM